jgi:23S rRNA pseudouridine2605 synthase
MDTKNENEEWQNEIHKSEDDADRDGNKLSSENLDEINRSSYSQNSMNRPHRPRINTGNRNGSYRVHFNADEEGSSRPYRPRFNSGNQDNGGYRPRYNNEEGGPSRPSYRPRYNNNDENGGQRPYRPRFNSNRDNNGGGYRPRYNNNDENGGPRPYRPRYNNNDEGNGGYRPRYNNNDENGGSRPRYNNNDENGQRPYRPRYNNDDNGGQRPYRPRFNQNNRQQGGYRPRSNDFNPNSKYSVKKQIEYKELNYDPNEPIRLNKYLANAGVCSRREADEFIQSGVVSVNGTVVTELGTKVKRSDEVKFRDQIVKIERKIYVLLNKPKDCVTTSDDPQERHTVMELVKDACQERIYPVGRLDRNTTGVLLLTNDGDLASKLTHPKYLKKKIYQVTLDKNVTRADLDSIVSGITLDDGEIHADAVEYIGEDRKNEVGIEIHSGKNRIVRRIFESLGYRVLRLDRVFFAGLTKKGLRRGEWRYLTEKELDFLRMGSFE